MSTRWSLTLTFVLASLLLLSGVASAQGPQPDAISQVTLPFEGVANTTGTAFGILNQGAGLNAVGLAGRTDNGYAGVVGYSANRYGVFGISVSPGDAGVFGRNDGVGIGVLGSSNNGPGVSARSANFVALRAETVNNHAAYITTPGNGFSAVWGEHTGGNIGYGVIGVTQFGHGVRGVSNNGEGVIGIGTSFGLSGTSTGGIGVSGASTSNVGVRAVSTGADGLEASSSATDRSAIYAHHDNGDRDGNGVYSTTERGYAVQALSSRGTGLYAEGRRGGDGLETYVEGDGVAVYAHRSNRDSRVAFFDGRVEVNGTLSKSAGSFKIDHPLDPANKYLSHSFVESPDMMNVYNGNITTNEKGLATVALPDYFDALNRDFRYQLTVIGQFAQAIVADEIKGNRFTIQTDKPNVKVSWQVTGIRKDAYAVANPIVVEEDKPAGERGSYLEPELFGQDSSKSIGEALQAAKPQSPAHKAERRQPNAVPASTLP